MTTELEKQFFDTFGIPKIYKTTINIGDLDVNLKEIQAPTLKELYEIAKYDFTTPIYFSWFKRSKRWSEDYPQITDRHYLELLCIFHNSPICLGGVNLGSVELLKERLLANFIQTMNMNVHQARKDELKHQVQELFKGE